MEEHGVTQTEHMATIEAHAVAQQVQQVHVATYTEHSMLSADEDSLPPPRTLLMMTRTSSTPRQLMR